MIKNKCKKNADVPKYRDDKMQMIQNTNIKKWKKSASKVAIELALK